MPVDSAGHVDSVDSIDSMDSHIIYTAECPEDAVKTIKKIDYDYKRCCGCGICVEICPTGALELGDMCAIGTGLDVPPVLLDPGKCSFCGMCAAFCPTKAVKLEINGEDATKRECYPHIDPKAQVNENCLPCSLCEEVCKTCGSGAIKLEYTFPKKEEIAPFKEGVEGEITIDMGKCNYCGICAYFCDAFILISKEKDEMSPVDPVPFENILIDEDECDYCVLCEDICPEDAITVKVKSKSKSGGDLDIERAAPRVTGTLSIDDSCVACGWCKSVCPYDAIEISKAFEGEIRLIGNHLIKCDPVGCHACFNVCPSNAWYVPQDKDKKIEVSSDLCTFCGACEHACWLDAIAVDRSAVLHTQECDSAWKEEWEQGIKSVTSRERVHPDHSHVVSLPAPEREVIEPPPVPVIDFVLLERVRERIDQIMPLLRDARTRRKWELVGDS
jgi:4Fe-4S ferredoxin